MLYIITEDSNSAREFWDKAASVYRGAGTYTMVPLLKGGGNTTLKAQIDEAFTFMESGDELFLVIDNIGRIHNFWSRDIISKTNVRCMRKGIRFAYTKYYCFEELYLSYSELLNMSNNKYKDVLSYVSVCLNSGTEYFDKNNLDARIINFFNIIGHSAGNKEHFANELLASVTNTVYGKFKIHKSSNVFKSAGACWVEDCIAIQGDMSPKEKESVCGGKCTFHCKDCKTKDKIQHLNSNSILTNW